MDSEFQLYSILTEAEAKKKADDEMEYGLPELKKFPMYDAKHVKLAVKFFNWVEPKYEKKLAAAIKRKLKEYNITVEPGEENRFSKYYKPVKLSEEFNTKFDIIADSFEASLRYIKNFISYAKDDARVQRDYKEKAPTIKKLYKECSDMLKEFSDAKKEKKENDYISAVLKLVRKSVGISKRIKKITVNLKEENDFEESKKLGTDTKEKYEKLIRLLKKFKGEETPEVKKLEAEIEKNNKEMNKINESEDLLNESILDPYREKRCPELFDENEKVHPEIREYILKSISDWQKTLEFPLNIKYIRLVGSLLGHFYSAETDIDVHIRADITDEQYDSLMNSRPNCHFIPNTLHPLEFSFMSEDENLDNAENIYDLIEDKWIKKTDTPNVDIPRDYITKISKAFMGMIDMSLGSAELHKKQLKEIQDLEISNGFSEEDKLRAIFKKKDELLEDCDTLRLADRLMSALRRQAYSDERNYFNLSIELVLPDDPHYSANEMIFKAIDKYGYKQKVRDTIKNLEEIIEKLNELKLPIVNGKETLARDDGEVSADQKLNNIIDDSVSKEDLIEALKLIKESKVFTSMRKSDAINKNDKVFNKATRNIENDEQRRQFEKAKEEANQYSDAELLSTIKHYNENKPTNGSEHAENGAARLIARNRGLLKK